ncbi:MAG TPA: histidine kinase dimerization/phosphoacceptor domain -containing protein, partial [Afifellaceae bacterium]|nr:histidine kinase dimerization/phosphoacceptor domain -containing protein [Afifellaceae bacterium]
RTLLDNLPIAVSMTAGREHRFVYANRLYRHILLPHAGDPVGRTVGEVFGALYSAESAAARDRLLEGGEANSMREVPIDLGETAPQMYWDVSQVPILHNDGTAQAVLDPSSGGHLRVEHRIVRPDGAVRWIIGQARMLYDDAGQPLRLIGTAIDATDRKEANEALRQALAAKEILLREVNHRVKNSLALVSSMLALQGRSIGDETLRRQMEDAQARIRTVALVHERLYTSAGTDSVRLDAYLRELCEDLQRTGLGGAVRIEFAAEPVRLSNDRAVPVALVLNELVTNALKYAYGSGGGTVWVDLRKAESGETCLVVRDQGAGLPPDFEARRATSLGFRIIDGLIRQLGGRFEAREPERGAEFALLFRAD